VHLQTRSITATKYIITEQWWVYGDSGVTEVECAMWSLYSGDPGVDRQHPSFISSCHTTKIHTLTFHTVGLTRSFRDFVHPHGRVVSYLFTFLRSLSFMSKERKERLLQRHPLHCNPDTSMYPMNPFQSMVAVGHNARVFV